MNQVLAILISFGVPFLIVIIICGIFLTVLAAKKRFLKDLKLRLLLIRLPQKAGESKEAMAEIGFAAQLFSLLGNLKTPFSAETAVHNVGENISFYISVPEESVEFAARQIQGFWPDASVQRTEDYTIFNESGATKIAHLKQKEHYALPIATVTETGIDTFSPILSNFSKVELVGEGVAMQVVVKPATVSIKKNIAGFITGLKKGASLDNALAGKNPEKKKGEEAAPIVVDEEAVKALTQKISKPLFAVNVRLVVSAMSPYRTEEILNSLTGSFSQFAAPNRNELKAVEARNQKEAIFKFVFREFNDSQTMILNSEELASIWHLPTSTTQVPKVQWIKSKEAAPPTILPESGTLIGESSFRGEGRSIYITNEDRRRHVYIIGQTGTGKSTLLVNMADGDMSAGRGIAVIDPHGELIESIKSVVPAERQKDVIVFDPGNIQNPPALNMLEYDPSKPEQKTFVVNEMQSIFNKLFSQETMGPMFEQYMRNALLLLMDDPNEKSTLADVPKVLTDSEYRKRLLEKSQNTAVVDFWTKEAAKASGEASLQNMAPYITSKFNNFIANDYVRPIISQPVSTFNFRKIMDEGKILLVNLSKGKIGDINASLLGMIVVGKLLMAALSRVDISQEQRKDFNLYIDEFQNFTTDSIATILSEARKYRLNLVIAHQFIKQLTEKIRDAVFGNVGSQIVFRVGAEDAEFLVKQFEPVFSKNDLINIDNFNAFVKILVNGQTTRPFNMKTLSVKKN